MDDNDLYKTIKFIEGYYNRKIENNEIVALKDELKDYTYQAPCSTHTRDGGLFSMEIKHKRFKILGSQA